MSQPPNQPPQGGFGAPQDPRQGVRKQGCDSPNALLRHVAIEGAREDVRNIAVDTVALALERAIAAARSNIPARAPAH